MNGNRTRNQRMIELIDCDCFFWLKNRQKEECFHTLNRLWAGIQSLDGRQARESALALLKTSHRRKISFRHGLGARFKLPYAPYGLHSYLLCQALHKTYGLNCEGRKQCYGDAGVSADAKSKVVRTKVKAEHLRQHPPLPPCSDKWKREYRKRSGLERLNSRLTDGCMLHSHYLRGQGNMGLKIIISMTVMLAASNVAIQSQHPEKVRSLIKALAA